jgi:hypothetical protein
MMQNEKELDEDVKETSLCPVARKWLINVVKVEVSIWEEVLEILGDFKKFITCELPNDFPPMRDKCQMDNADEALYQNVRELKFSM